MVDMELKIDSEETPFEIVDRRLNDERARLPII